MTMPIRRLTLSLAVLLLCGALSAQVTREKLLSSPDALDGCFHPYPDAPGPDTPPPPGYRPFYISHYGRHGSRTDSHIEVLAYAPDLMRSLRGKGLLSERGAELEALLREVLDASEGYWGELTDLGAREHMAIARRMYRRFRPVFRDRTRREVRCVASKYTRTIASMAASSGELRSLEPGLRFHYRVGDRYQQYMLSQHGIPEEYRQETILRRQQRIAGELDPLRAGALLFSDPPAALQEIDDIPGFFRSIWSCWALRDGLELPVRSLRDFLDDDSILTVWGSCDAASMCQMSYPSSRPLMRDILAKADSSVRGGTFCADLRYGHDVILLRWLNLIGAGAWPFTFDQANALLDGATAIPMGSNLQLVFYRSHKGPVLVKMLFNEQERPIPGLTPVREPYYRWEDVLAHWKTLL